jgi:2-aminoethylphosphonate-pyruvate transaminase
MNPLILLNPGPVSLTKRVRNALLNDDLCHREPEFSELQTKIRQKLVSIYNLQPSTWASVLLTGSGTAAVEAMIASLVPENQHLLIIENGVYGERMTKIACAHGIEHEVLRCDWTHAIESEKLNEIFQRKKFSHVAVVHHETTTGRLNKLDELGNICKRHSVRILLDGVSSFGGENIEFEKWNLDACAATANKCLHGVPGAAFVLVNRTSLSNGRNAKTVYLDLSNYLSKQDLGETPFTQSIQCFYALNEALDEFSEAGGWRQRNKTFRTRMDSIRNCLAELGVKNLINKEDSSCVLASFKTPAQKSYVEIHDNLKESGFIIYAGQGKFSSEVFRISPMGNITNADMRRLLSALKKAIQ